MKTNNRSPNHIWNESPFFCNPSRFLKLRPNSLRTFRFLSSRSDLVVRRVTNSYTYSKYGPNSSPALLMLHTVINLRADQIDLVDRLCASEMSELVEDSDERDPFLSDLNRSSELRVRNMR